MKKNLRAAPVLCPCDSGWPYATCCAPWHVGLTVGVHAPTPEALMRSRYSAFVRGLVDYLLATWHPSTRPSELALSPVKWRGLEVRRATAEGAAGLVEFVARSREGGRAQRMHETSRFVRLNERWYYLDDQMAEST
jgi:SEC-C motif-containing protein